MVDCARPEPDRGSVMDNAHPDLRRKLVVEIHRVLKTDVENTTSLLGFQGRIR